MNLIIGTGGHIDHGKTALIAALTGTDTDRLPEEKRRGISIDLGFSRMELDGATFGIVDVPGHEDFIRNMLAGATGIDLLLLVVAADEGVMPQTREHVAIAELLAVPGAVVALTKTDLVEAEWLALARDDVADFLEGTRFAGAPIVATSATTGAGLEDLRATLGEAVPRTRRDPGDLFRLPVDRVFTVKGTGTVVTGTVWSGALADGAAVRIQPGGASARVRGLQVHGRETDRVVAGQRAAVALTGVDRDQVRRGDTLLADEGWEAASLLTARLDVLPGSTWQIEERQRVRVHLGTSDVLARVGLLDAERLTPGDSGWAQLRLESPLLARAGDRFVVRSYSPVTTIGGGRVAEPAAGRRKGVDRASVARLEAVFADDPAMVLAAVVEAAGRQGVPVRRLPVDAGVAVPAVQEWLEASPYVVGGRAFTPDQPERLGHELLAAIRQYHQENPLRPGIELEALRRSVDGAPELVEGALERLVERGAARVRRGRVAAAGFEPRATEAQQAAADAVVQALAGGGAAPPGVDELERIVGDTDLEEILGYLEQDGTIIRVQPGFYLHANVLDRLAGEVVRRLGGRADLGPAEFREVINVSRKHLIPILEHLDVRGVTVRQGEGRAVPAR